MASGTPSAQVRVPVGDLIFFDPPLLLTLYYLGKIYKGCQRTADVGVKLIRWRNKNPGQARVGKKFEKKIKKSSHCRKLSHSDENTSTHILIPFGTIPYPYTLPKSQSYYIAELS